MASLLIEIARCANVLDARASSSHPCHRVVNAQPVRAAEFHVPEPWSGDIARAPILFVSSNPALAQAKDDGAPDAEYPTGDWSDEMIVDFFNHRFCDGKREWVRDGNRALLTDGSHARANPFWAAVKKRAEELLQREAVPGVDYALTEVVHCKSAGEHGVCDAVDECAGRYVGRLLEHSGAAVIVVLGAVARDALKRFAAFPAGPLSTRFVLSGRERLAVLLPHPNARAVRSFLRCLAREDVELLRRHLSQERSPKRSNAEPTL